MLDPVSSSPSPRQASSRWLADLRARLMPFVKFGVVGTFGLMWDTATVYGFRALLGLTGATILAYFVAATMNWLLNRHWTFRHVVHADHPLVQWARFLMANSLGFVLNRGMVFTLFLTVPLCRTIPFLALAAGSLTGLFANFTLSHRVVFRHRQATAPTPSDPEFQSAPERPACQNAASSFTAVRNSDSSIG
ncbi:GtrA family protein [Gluconacetobacter diazotrophicus PA1 5]|uniref:GtrA family protein n=1 Tax=Gluconacetobacter diazotrophicus TaxID=33996 RepID=A0A7W4I3E0_GLUDI|nr:GtrA family protein [Gluconacetobacter diazotrophicus]ACI50201.1 GtrA family protein [Gluconacetobacter diazotrophicus PA1 5]MBB2154879.1 GtrA family protein [Gluconacetobacter diazotrophicus]TWB08043.1 putative flippase GtrA [Gluconacetobacter diazotrophicus]